MGLSEQRCCLHREALFHGFDRSIDPSLDLLQATIDFGNGLLETVDDFDLGELSPAYLKALDSQHTCSDGDVRRIAGEAGEALSDLRRRGNRIGAVRWGRHGGLAVGLGAEGSKSYCKHHTADR